MTPCARTPIRTTSRRLPDRQTLCLAIGLTIAAALAGTPGARAAVTLKIKNLSGEPVAVMWTGMTTLTGSSNGISIAPSDFNVNAAGYLLSNFNQVSSNVYQIDNFSMSGGRMWFTYGTSNWTFQNAGYTPSLANFNDPNFGLRYDKIEAYIMGSTDDNLDITAVDAFSIPFAVSAYVASNPSGTTQTLKGSLGRSVYDALAAVAANAGAPKPVTPTGANPPLAQISGNSPYLVINANSQGLSTPGSYAKSPVGSSGAFVRIIANDNLVTPYAGDPVAAANGNQVPANYNWTNYEGYLKRMDGRAVSTYAGTTRLAGAYAGLKVPTGATTTQASYNLNATFDPTEKRTVTYTVPPPPGQMPPGTGPFTIDFTGFVTLSGTSTIASGTYAGTYNVVLKIPYGGLPQYMTVQSGFANPHAFLLDPSGVVGANANYLYKYYLNTQPDPGVFSQTDPYHGGPQNDVLTWVLGDLLAGMNVGTVGSDKTLPNPVTINGNTYAAGTKVGAFDSQDWWSLGSTMRTGGSESVYNYYFGFLQSDPNLYNRFAETIYPFTDAYGFAYSDRITDGRAAISWDATKAGAIDTVEIVILPDARVSPNGAFTTEVTEFHHASLDHYFMTSDPAEIAKLDEGTELRGWTRTGRTIRAHATAQPGTSPVCRFYLPPASGDSHFFGRDPAECNATAANYPAFVAEHPAIMHMFMPSQGACPAGTTPVYRVFSNRRDTNHRYVTDTATRDQMAARGWLPEGDGPDRVVMCAP